MPTNRKGKNAMKQKKSWGTRAERAVVTMALCAASMAMQAAHAGGRTPDPSQLPSVEAGAIGFDATVFVSGQTGGPAVSAQSLFFFDVLAGGVLSGEFHLPETVSGQITSLLFGGAPSGSLAPPPVARVGMAGVESWTGRFETTWSADGKSVTYSRQDLKPGYYAIGVEMLVPPNESLQLAGTISVTPVPEPGTLWLSLMGLAGVSMVVRRRR